MNRRASFVTVCALLLLAIPVWSAASDETAPAAANLLKNGDFSLISADQPEAWRPNTWGGEAEFSIDRETGHLAAPCVRISSADGADASWSYRASLKPNTQYRFSAWVKTEGFRTGTGFGALLNIHELQLENRSPAVSADSDWQQIATEFDSGPRNELLLNLLFGGWGESTGTAWFDDVELVELKSSATAMTEAEAISFYETRIKPVFAEHCAACHVDDPSDFSGGLAITGRAALLRGGHSGPAVDLQAPETSLLLKAINHEVFQMPPDGKLAQEQIDDIRRWLTLGMPWTAGEEVDHGVVEKPSLVTDEARRWWAFQPPARPELPAVKDAAWCRNGIDHFILARLELEGFRPAPQADRRTLIRRASYDLTGLPPTAEEIDAFVNDQRPDAWEQLIERLLASPHYGEKWGRHWLDLVRYAESNSFERDGTKPYVWRYRDYVIRSFNADKPYDRFLTEQLAGDELPDASVETVTATGYYRLGQWDDEPADPLQAKYDDLDDILATTSQTMLGLTVNCARCHDHKIDPLLQADYYRMLAFFGNIRRYGVRGHDTVLDASVIEMQLPPGEERDLAEAGSAQRRIKLDELNGQIAGLEGKAKAGMEGVDLEDFQYEMRRVELMEKQVGKTINEEEFRNYRALRRQRRRLEDQPDSAIVSLLAVKETGPDLLPTSILIRGNAHVPGVEVEPGFPEVLGGGTAEIVAPASGLTSGARLALARWIASPDNPLTARVMANRVWQYHFGDGLVRTSSDYGFQGSKPTHPDLLDWLADELVEGGWSLKHLHRQIMNSAAWQMSGAFDEAAYASDPENELLWRYSLRRLTSEEIRDSILLASGKLNLDDMFGPSIFPKLPDEVLQGQSMPGDGWGDSPPDQQNRRAVYIHVKRSMQVPLLASHDMSDTDFTCPVRFVTTQPTQALNMLNSQFSGAAARDLAALVRREHPEDISAQIARAFRRVTQRSADPAELAKLEEHRQGWLADGLTPDAALDQLCLMLLNLNEFMYVD
jgi:mono/diheme cytochrome c family protein